jgi:ComF family protein
MRIMFPVSCYGCGKKEVPETPLCRRCLALARKSLSAMHPWIISTFDFPDPLIKRVIHAIKYHHRRDLIGPLIPYLSESAKSIENLREYVLIPVPMPYMRKLMRGYNQAELIASSLASTLGLRMDPNILARATNPQRQAMIHEKAKRIENQKGTFKVRENLSGVRILLVDDVTTTGATLEEAKRTLEKAGAAHVSAITIAH